MIINAANRSACFSALARKSARSMLPSRSQPTTTTFIPAIAALAGLVPCAEDGIRHMSRCCSPRDSCHARITSRPAYSPCEPAFGCSDTAANPVTAQSQVCQAADHGQIPCRLIRWRERMDIGEPGQRDRDHLGGRVQLHRARPQRDHAAVERYVLVFQALEIAQHLVFGVMLAEGGLLQKRRTPQQFRGDATNSAGQVGPNRPARATRSSRVTVSSSAIADAGFVDTPEIVASLGRASDQVAAILDHDGVEERIIPNPQPGP